ncbi:MAG: LysE family translocator [Deltaproteobacteria bacterium]|nr:LysE family translocator [Deltaproteobacteria bacterium]
MPDQSFHWVAFLTFVLVQSSTPGPNVIMLAGSGSSWGFKKTIPHLAGVCVGFPIMVLLVQLGAGEVFLKWPWLYSLLTILSLLYVLWLALRIFETGFRGKVEITRSKRPMSFLEAALFQWVNGKAWQIVIMTATLYPSNHLHMKILQALSFLIALIITGSLWIELGKRIARYLQRPLFRKIYYSTLATALLLSTWPRGIQQLLN